MISVQFLRKWEDRHADPSGATTTLYPQGLAVEVPPERAAYLFAAGYAIPIGEVTDEVQAATTELEEVVKLLRSHNAEPTIEAVYMTLAEIARTTAQQPVQTSQPPTEELPAAADVAAAAEEPAKPARKKATA